MKKALALVLALTMMVFAFGCANTKKQNNLEKTPSEQTSQPEKTEQPENKIESVNVSVGALKGPTAMGLVKLMDESDGGQDLGNKYNFTIAASPDEITPKLVTGELNIAAVPANLASVIYNTTKGKVQVIAVNTLGVLYIVENGDSIKTAADLKGKTIYASGKGATPEYALNYMLTSNGLDPEKDVTIEYKSEHSECVAAISALENGIAMLPQPFVTTAQMANDKIRVALDLTKEWENASECTLITGVMVANTDFVKNNPEAVAKFLEQYKKSVDYVNENTADGAKLVEKYNIVKAAVAEKAIPYCNICCVTGDEMKNKLSGYLGVLSEQNPKAVGGTLPADDFYYLG